ncbi:MAG: RdgB/HAM1 family non-canonical purine NTP pyrophosphatase [Candidatus Dormibacteria bacterium]
MLLATTNAGKLAEFERLLAGRGVELVSPSAIDLQLNVDEDGATFLANAQKKAREYAAAAAMPVLADDSGLVVDALGGAPGVETARYGGAGLTARDRYQVLLRNLEGVADRSARFVCVLALAQPGKPVRLVFVGQCDGRIGRHPVGEGGFGYDPVFVLADGRSMAELEEAEKDRLSHRGLAVEEMLRSVDLAAWAESGLR